MNDILNYNILIDSLTVTPMWELTYTPCDTLTDCLTYTLTVNLLSILYTLTYERYPNLYRHRFLNGYSDVIPRFPTFLPTAFLTTASLSLTLTLTLTLTITLTIALTMTVLTFWSEMRWSEM